MVPDQRMKQENKVQLKILLNQFVHMKNLAKEKQQCIIENDWSKLADIVHEQNTLKKDIENCGKNSLSAKTNDEDEMRRNIKKEINAYKEIETINVRLLKDALYLAKLKASKLFNLPLEEETYTADSALNATLLQNRPLVMDSFV